ncbi:MAG: tetratricopeptide repeat protein [Gemmataceae bacterium]|nr:tetratricopeptide repeat protein [Gemmataceae bacterium]
MRTVTLLVLAAAVARMPAAGAADDPDPKKLLADAAAAYREGKFDTTVKVARDAIRLDPRNPEGHYVLGLGLLGTRDNEGALACFRETLRLDPGFRPDVYDRMGDALLKLGKFKESVAAFDKFLELRPKFAPDHWRRGIALYYAGRFDDGKKQFDLHRTVNPEDVENSAWHYLCNARATSPTQARKDLIPVSKDARVPMKEVLELFAGKLKPADVLAAAEASGLKGERLTEARFYAHLYVGLYYESEGDAAKTLDHLTTAVEKYKIGHYMWDVGNAHLKTLKK